MVPGTGGVKLGKVATGWLVPWISRREVVESPWSLVVDSVGGVTLDVQGCAVVGWRMYLEVATVLLKEFSSLGGEKDSIDFLKKVQGTSPCEWEDALFCWIPPPYLFFFEVVGIPPGVFFCLVLKSPAGVYNAF